MKKQTKRWLALAVLAVLVVAVVLFEPGQWLTLEAIKAKQGAFQALYEQQPILVSAVFFLAYLAVATLSLPGAALLTVLAGALFGLLWGVVLVSFASSMGATLAFLVARFVLRDWVQQRFGARMQTINDGMQREGALYLFTLRLIPAVPFFIVNLLMGLTKLPVRTFYGVSQLGMLAGTLVYVNAGTQLAEMNALADILSPGLIFSFVLLGVFPLLARRVLDRIKARRIYQGHVEPTQFDANLVVIGSGAAGLVNAYIAAAVKAKVVLIEKSLMGGDCLNYGCVPSKALIKTAKLLDMQRRGAEFGLDAIDKKPDFAQVMERVKRVIAKVAPHDSVARYEGLGVEVIQGEARISSPWTVEVNGRTLRTRSIVIATGAQPLVPPIPGLDKVDYLTSDTIWDLRQRPERLLVLGGGPIGSELTQAFARLGCQVTQVERNDRLLGREDPEISAAVQARFERDGVRVLTGHSATAFVCEEGQQLLLCEHEGATVRIPFDRVLVALGRQARVKGFGLEELGIALSPRGTVAVNGFLETNYPNIYAAGDVAGPYQFTHTAGHMAWYTSVNALFGFLKRFKVDYRVVPWSTFTDPEVARVGLNETDAKAQGIAYQVTRYGLDELDRAIADGEDHGVVKILTPPDSDRILGVTIMGEHAGDLLAEFVLAMKHGLGLNKILATIHIYPTMAEANKYAAGEWKRSQVNPRTLRWLERLHAWRRKSAAE